MDFTSHFLAISGFLAFFLLYNLVWRTKDRLSQNKGKLPPEPSGALPLIGHLHLLGTHKTLPRTLAAMSDQYGPIFTIRLGANRVVVVNNSEAIKECFTTYDKVLASRPKSSHGEYLGYKYAAFGFASYGPFWREIRKIVMIQLLSTHRLKSLRHVQIEEVNTLIKNLYKRGPTKVVISELFEQLTLNVITRMIAGKRYFGSANDAENEEGKRIGKLMKEFMYISGVFVPSDVIPILGCINSFLGPLKTLKRLSRELDSVMQGWIEEHKLKVEKNDSDDMDDFIEIMLSAIKDDFMFGHSRETIIKATALTLIIAGADTTSITLTWILSNLLNNRRAMELAQEEIDLKIGKERWVEEYDITNLVYLQAVIKETLRLYPPGPLAVPHEATENICISGYEIAKGTRLFVNLWKLHRDPNMWKNPEEFKPDRFITNSSNIDVSGQFFELIPFGSGRRSCPGMTFALQLIPLTLARLLQGFQITTPMNSPVDMSEGQGITLPKATPLEVQIAPRLFPQVY